MSGRRQGPSLGDQGLRLQEGTKVVLNTTVPGATRSVPVGTVAEISHIAADGAGPYRIRFADGLEADVAANAFDLLVRVKAPTPSRTAEASIEQQLGDRVIYRCVIGSRAYGLDTPDSDTDRRGVYQAPTDLVVSLDPPPERLEDDANQEVLWELRKFLVLALKANPIAIEVLFSPLVDVVMPAGQALLDIRAAFLSRLVYQTFSGYAMSQSGKMRRSIDLEQAPNWKRAMHVVRVLELGIATLETGEPRLVSEHREQLLEIRAGAWSWERFERWRLQLHERFEVAFSSTDLPERPDYRKANDYLVRARRDEFRSAS